MASSNRHWPSMFKSKPCNRHQMWPHDIISSCQKQPYSSSVGLEERSPEPKPRWNPKPEQIRILEAIFNSGMVNPPRDEIRKIRAQLQEYGQVGDANVFYWFQNRKSRSKHKQRLLAAKSYPPTTTNLSSSSSSFVESNITIPPPVLITDTAATNTSTTTNSNSSNSSEKTSHAVSFASFLDQSVNSPSHSTAASIDQIESYNNHQTILHQHAAQDYSRPVAFPNVPFSFTNSDDVCELSGMVQFQEQMKQVEKLNVIEGSNDEQKKCTINPMMQDFGDYVSGFKRSTVFINDLAFEVSSVPLNVKEAFGDTAVLLHSSGHPVMTDEFGITLQPLQNGGFYYLV